MSQETRIDLRCTICGERNYATNYNKKSPANKERLGLDKFCKKCRKHTPHKQNK